MKGKRGFMMWDALGWWIIGIAVLVIVAGFFIAVYYSGFDVGDFIKNFARFR